MNWNLSSRTIYIAIAVGVLLAGLLVYGLSVAVTQAGLALVTGAMLLVGNAPELVRSMQRRELGLALLNTLIGVALVSFFLVKWLGFVFYLPLIAALIFAAPLMLNRVAIANTYVGLLKTLLVPLRRAARIPAAWLHR